VLEQHFDDGVIPLFDCLKHGCCFGVETQIHHEIVPAAAPVAQPADELQGTPDIAEWAGAVSDVYRQGNDPESSPSLPHFL
jgi:hypothetical protein